MKNSAPDSLHLITIQKADGERVVELVPDKILLHQRARYESKKKNENP